MSSTEMSSGAHRFLSPSASWAMLCVCSIAMFGCDQAPMTGEDAGEDVDAASDAGTDAGVGDVDSGGCRCDDGIACTEDSCQADGSCRFEPVHTACPDGEFCRPGAGCEAGPACAIDADCTRPDPCVSVRCDPVRRQCVYATLDGDGDGYPPFVCRGSDCDDSRADVNPGVTADVCDGVDADCSGSADPIDAPGCAGEETCDGTSCVCVAPAAVCGGECVDLQTNMYHCGACFDGCSLAGESCVTGQCRCPSGQMACGWSCVDPTSDESHCGRCDNACGEASCVSSSCSCPAGTTQCSGPLGAIECADVATDARHCGACGTRCFDLSSCGGATCEVQASGVLRGYAYLSPVSRLGRYRRVGAVDSTTGAAAAIQEDDAHPILEVGTTTPVLYTGGIHVVHYRADGGLGWAIQTTLSLEAIAYDGGHLYVIGTSNATSATLGTSTFVRPTGYSAFAVLAELSSADGSVLFNRLIPSADSLYGIGFALGAALIVTQRAVALRA